MCRTLIVCVVTLMAQLTPSDSVGWDGPVLRGSIVRPTSDFVADRIGMQFQDILWKNGAKASIIDIEAMDNPNSYMLTAMGRDELNYDIWRELFSIYEKHIPPMAELLQIGHNSAMRLRDSQGHVSEIVLRGNNPYVIHACGKDLSLIHLGIYDPKRPPEFTETYTELRFFLVAQHQPDRQMAECAFSEARRLSGIQHVSVIIRLDPWFIVDSLFPVVSPFLQEVHPLSKQALISAPEWSCTALDNGKTFCSGRTLTK
jgi:hypothetical protein